jgi:ABC-2 type transport system permease protein
VIRLVRAELLKLTSTRLWLWLGLLTLALVALLLLLTAANNDPAEIAQRGHQRDLVGFAAVSALIALILGIVGAAGEYAHQTIGQTFLVSPVRERVVAAKLAAGAVSGFVLAALALVESFGLTAVWVAGKSVPSHLGSREVLLAVPGTLMAAAIAGAIGVGLGALLRRQTAGIVLSLIWLLVGEPLLAVAGIQRYAPGHAIAAVTDAGRRSSELLRFWPGTLVALVYAAVLAAAGALAVSRSDVT